MKPEQQNKSIAAHCGWKQSTSSMWEGWWHQKGKKTYQQFCPDYCNDLNAMHEAEKTIPIKLQFIYTSEIVVAYTGGRIFMGEDNRIPIAFASASQKAEAFLKTIGKWEDEQ